MKRTPVLALVLVASCVLALTAWLRRDPAGPGPDPVTPAASDAHNRGLARMGQYDFVGAVEILEPLARAHPGWLDLQVDLGIALLNRGRPDTRDLDRALDMMKAVQAADPANLRAHFCAGILLLYRGHIAEALPYFLHVAAADARDGYAACFAADCLYQLDRLDEALAWYAKSQERDPYLRSPWYGAFRTLRLLGRDEAAAPMLAMFKRLETNPQARVAEIKYTRMGPHALVRPFDVQGPAPALPEGPAFEVAVPLPVDGEAPWAKVGTPTFTACDVDGDGQVDLFAAQALEGATPNAVLLRRGERFELAADHPLAAVPDVRAALWGDLDNDGRTDVVLCRRGANRAFLQQAGGGWRDVTDAAGLAGTAGDTPDGALLDIDHDGDLDVVYLHAAAPLEVLVNRLDGTFMPLPADAALPTDGRPATGLVPVDLDSDRDVDLLVLHEDGPHEVFVNDRLWQWHVGEPARYGRLCAQPAVAALATDADADGAPELHLLDGEHLWTWTQDATGSYDRASPGRTRARRLAVLDADGDGRLELLLGGLGWSVRPAGEPVRDRWTVPDLSAALPFSWSAGQGEAVVAWAPAVGPVLSRPGPGRHPFLALSFSGKHAESEQMRSNADGLGVRVAVRIGTRWTVRSTYRPVSGGGQSLQPLAIGLAGAAQLDYVDLRWTDGLLQTERELASGQVHGIQETQRQTSSCPVLFVWDGRQHAFVTDLLGVGGVGFWVAPDTYAPPAPQEVVLLPPGLPKAQDGHIVLKLGEPMEEACYLDGARLEAVDVPPGWHLAVDDRMAVEGPAPTGALVFHRDIRYPTKAVDQAGRDVRAALHDVDLRAADVAAVDGRFIGRTAEQVITLEFDRPLDAGPGAPVLLADGWIEYPYAQTMFAAWQAAAPYEAPTVEARGADGSWTTVLAQYGYPAGMPRRSSVPLGVLPRGTRALRVRTTQEIYWDRLAVTYTEDCQEAVRTDLPLANASLAFAGFARRTTGPQRLPHYTYAERTPLWDVRHQAGFYTRFGPVEELIRTTDDAVVIFGPGEEVEMRFRAPEAPPRAGFTRWYVLHTAGWCKDMDLFTRDGETVGPLPVRAEDGRAHPARDALHARYQTRYASGR